MGSVKQYMRPGEHRGTRYGIEIFETGPGRAIVNAIHLHWHAPRILEGAQRREFDGVEDAFRHGAEIARLLIDERL